MQRSLWAFLRALFGAKPAPAAAPPARRAPGDQEARALAEFCRHFGLTFRDPALLKLALTHRSYLSVTGQGPFESNERLEFLGDSVLGLVTSEHLYRAHPSEHEGQLTKTKSLLVSKAILSRRALAMGLGRFVLMSHSEVESGGRQRLSIIADAFESVIGAIYLDQGFEAARAWIERWLLRDAGSIMADKRHVNYKSHLQEYVQSTFRTHPVYRIRSEMGPDHLKHFNVEVMVGRRLLGEGRGRNKKEAEQAAARDALDRVGVRQPERRPEPRRPGREPVEAGTAERATPAAGEVAEGADARRRRGRRGGRGRRPVETVEPAASAPVASAEPAEHRTRERAPAPPRERVPSGGPYALPPEDGRFERLRLEAEQAEATDLEVVEVEAPPDFDEDDYEEVGRPEGPLEGPLEERHVDLYAWGEAGAPPAAADEAPGDPVPSPDDGGMEEASWSEDAEAAPEPARESESGAAGPPPRDPGPAARGRDAEPASGPRSPEFGRRRGRRR